jgi:hypothetical protein
MHSTKWAAKWAYLCHHGRMQHILPECVEANRSIKRIQLQR